MADFPKSIDCGEFRLEKVAPTFNTARYLFELVDSQRQYMAEWLGWVDKSNCPEDMYPHLLKSSEITTLLKSRHRITISLWMVKLSVRSIS